MVIVPVTPDPGASLDAYQQWSVAATGQVVDTLGLLLVALVLGCGFLVLSIMLNAGASLRR